jgi:HK97 family phage prohead protease
MPKPEGLQYKDIIGEIREIGEDGTLVAAISTDAIDRMGEVLDPSGVDLKNYKKNPVVLWAHDYEKPPIAKAQWVKRQGNVIMSKLKFAPTEFAQEIKTLYEQKFLNTFSVGFIPKNWEDGEDGNPKKARRTFTEWELLEYSAVPVPANPEALALAMKKGFIKSNELKSLIKEPLLQEFNNEEETTYTSSGAAETKIIQVVNEVKENSQITSELLAETETLRKQVESKDKEIIELKYKYYILLKQQQDSLSEITAKNFAKEVGEEVRGVIRRLQGKLD